MGPSTLGIRKLSSVHHSPRKIRSTMVAEASAGNTMPCMASTAKRMLQNDTHQFGDFRNSQNCGRLVFQVRIQEKRELPRLMTTTMSSGQLAVLMSAPMTPQFSLFGKVSANYLTVEIEDSTPFVATVDDSNFHLGVGAGVAFQVSDQMGIRATFERLMITDAGNSNNDFDVDQIAVALNYSF